MNTCVESIAPAKDCATGAAHSEEPESLVNYREPVAAQAGRSRSLTRWLGFSERRASSKAPRFVHIHVDSLFVSVEKILNPKLCGKAVLVGREVVCSASEEAKLRGITIGMTLRQALRVCPTAVVVPGDDPKRYEEFAERVRQVLESFSTAVEVSALGGFYLDLGDTGGFDSNFVATLRRLQIEILERTGLSVSLGAGRSKVVASIASQLERPRGFRLVEADAELAFLSALPVERLRSLGKIDPVALKQCGISTIGQLRSLPKPLLVGVFGEVIGLQLWNAARGSDVVPPPRKPVREALFAVAKLWALGSPARLARRMAAAWAEVAGGTPSLG